MVFNATFNTISVISRRSAKLVEETGVPGENWQALSHNVSPPWKGFELTTLVVIDTDCTGRCKSYCRTVTTTSASRRNRDKNTVWRYQSDSLNIFYCPKHDNRIRYNFCNLEHLLLYINNIQIQLNINAQKLQSFLIIRKKNPTTWNIRVQHNLIFAKWQIEKTFTIIGLVYRTHLEWRKSIIVIQCSGNINSVKVGSFKI